MPRPTLPTAAILWLAILVIALHATSSTAQTGQSLLINNGLAPPNPGNVIDVVNPMVNVRVRNRLCPPTGSCGRTTPTHVELAPGSHIGLFYIFDTSIGTVSGGRCLTANAYHRSTLFVDGGLMASTAALDDATLVMTNGVVGGDLAALEQAEAHLYGGWILGQLRLLNDSKLYVYGSNFAVNGVPVPYGVLTDPVQGQLTGRLASGQPLDNYFVTRGSNSYTAELILVFDPRDVEIDILPFTGANPIRIDQPRPVAVAIFGSEFFPIDDIDVSTLGFGPANASVFPDQTIRRDVDRDGYVDLVAFFRISDSGIGLDDDEACLLGELVDGSAFEGCDAVAPFE